MAFLRRSWFPALTLVGMLSGCGGGGGGGGGQSSGGAPMPPAPSRGPPATPTLTITQLSGHPGDVIAMSAVSADVANSVLTFSWTFGDGATAIGANVSHVYSAEGTFAPRVTVTNDIGLSSSATANSSITIAFFPVAHFQIFPSNQEHFLGQTLLLETSDVATDQNGFALTYEWSFGDGTTASGPKVTHVYAAAGTYTVTLSVKNSLNRSSSTQTTARVFAATAPLSLADNQFAPYCAGAYCGAAGPGSYAGTGIGIWRYHNATTSTATVDIEISGVHDGQSASLVFSNGASTDASTLPDFGALASMQAPGSSALTENPPTRPLATESHEAPLSDAQSSSDSAHDVVMSRNLTAAREFLRGHRVAASSANSPSRAKALAMKAAPALGTARVWYDNFGGATPYGMEVAATCPLSSGRNAIFWIDSAQVASRAISATRIQFMVTGLCGTDGAYARQIALTGDIWGPAAAGTGYIEDAPGAPLDLNIVIPGVPTSTSWGGYFSSGNLTPAAPGSNANGALAVFVNPFSLVASADDKMAGATLIHELKHHINYYQRTVARGVIHPPWLEETSAMLSEDAFTLPALGFNRAELRHDGYVFSGAGTGYLAWQYPDGQSYNQGGSFGAFLHRRYGLDVDRRLVDTCADDGTPGAGYRCLDSLIATWGGRGFADEFDRLGASVFGGMSKGSFPSGFGFPSIERDGVLLQPFGSASVTYPPSNIHPRTITQLLATMHSYVLDVIGTGQTVYKRQGVIVPAGTSLLVVIQ